MSATQKEFKWPRAPSHCITLQQQHHHVTTPYERAYDNIFDPHTASHCMTVHDNASHCMTVHDSEAGLLLGRRRVLRTAHLRFAIYQVSVNIRPKTTSNLYLDRSLYRSKEPKQIPYYFQVVWPKIKMTATVVKGTIQLVRLRSEFLQFSSFHIFMK